MHTSPPLRRPSPSAPHPEFLVIGLFALRLTKRLIEGLEYYPGRDSDITWLANFLNPYHHRYALASVSGSKKDDYVTTYQDIVSRMKRQPRFPFRFMQMNPDRSSQQHGHREQSERPQEMTDSERLDIIDFCDAASEWGSVVPIPAREAERMVELADQRRIADLEARQLRVEEREDLREEARVRPGNIRQPREEPRGMLHEEMRVRSGNTSRPMDDRYFGTTGTTRNTADNEMRFR